MDCGKEEETDFRWERKPHPMCIPHIVDGILGHLSVKDLKSCRLISSQYNEIACKVLQSEETITFKSISQLETYLQNIKPISMPTPSKYRVGHFYSSTSSLCSEDLTGSEFSYDEDDQRRRSVSSDDEKSGTDDEYWSLYVHEDHVPCGTLSERSGLFRYSHRSFHFDYCDPSEEIETFDSFFKRFGTQILRLKYTTDLLPYNFPKTLGHMGEVWGRNLPNLTELILEMKWGVPAHLFGNIGEDEVHLRNPHVLLPSLRKLHLDVLLTDRDADRAELFFQQLLSVTPNIEEISIPGSKRFFDDYINVVLARAIMASEVPRLSVLNFCLALSDAQMQLLRNKELPLTTLILDLEDLQFDAGAEGDNIDHHDDNNENDDENNQFPEEDEIRPDFPRQNQNRRPSYTPITRRTLQRFLESISSTLSSLHICFPQSPRHYLHKFKFQGEMTELKFLALGYFAGSSRMLDQLPALKKLELWNAQFRDCLSHGKVVPDKYQGITSVIS